MNEKQQTIFALEVYSIREITLLVEMVGCF
jgi:hypothetical protein